MWKQTFYLQCYKVGYDKADLGVDGFGCSHARSTIVDCSHALAHGAYSWVSRAPRPLPPATNLIRIFTTNSWIAVLICIISVGVFLLVAAKLGLSYGVGTGDYVAVAFVPIRLGLLWP